MKHKNLIIGMILISIAFLLTVAAAELYNSNMSFIWGVFVGTFNVYGVKHIEKHINEKRMTCNAGN